MNYPNLRLLKLKALTVTRQANSSRFYQLRTQSLNTNILHFYMIIKFAPNHRFIRGTRSNIRPVGIVHRYIIYSSIQYIIYLWNKLNSQNNVQSQANIRLKLTMTCDLQSRTMVNFIRSLYILYNVNSLICLIYFTAI